VRRLSRALVTGASGFLGRHLVEALHRRYDVVDCVDVRAPVQTCTGQTWQGDVREVLPGLARHDAVFHLAATVGGRAGLEDAPLGVAGNLALDVAFFEHVARTRPAHAVYLSSSAVYPERARGQRHAEQDVQPGAARFERPDGTYGWVKLTGEHLAQLVRERYAVPVVCYRPFTVYGPHQGTDYPVTAIAARALARADPLVLWGSGDQRRDLVHVADAVEAIARTHDQPAAVGPLNVCTGIATTFADLARTCAALVGYAPEIVGDTSRPAGVAARVGCPEQLGRWYTPGRSVLDGVSDVLAWVEQG
jgi:GDP-L-fucose synthase